MKRAAGYILLLDHALNHLAAGQAVFRNRRVLWPTLQIPKEMSALDLVKLRLGSFNTSCRRRRSPMVFSVFPDSGHGDLSQAARARVVLLGLAAGTERRQKRPLKILPTFVASQIVMSHSGANVFFAEPQRTHCSLHVFSPGRCIYQILIFNKPFCVHVQHKDT